MGRFEIQTGQIDLRGESYDPAKLGRIVKEELRRRDLWDSKYLYAGIDYDLYVGDHGRGNYQSLDEGFKIEDAGEILAFGMADFTFDKEYPFCFMDGAISEIMHPGLAVYCRHFFNDTSLIT